MARSVSVGRQLGPAGGQMLTPFGDRDPSQATMFPGPKILELGQSKAGNGFSDLEIGGHRVDMVGWPLVGLVGCPLGQLGISWGS